MFTVQQKFEFVMDQSEKFLVQQGFSRTGKYIRKLPPGGQVRWSIWPQKHRRNTADEIRFTFEVAAEWKRRPVEWPDIPKATWYMGVGQRIGFLMPKKEDTWWDIDENTSAEFLSDQFNAVLSNCVLPFFGKLRTEQDIKNYLIAAADGEMKRNYHHTIAMLGFDLEEKKPPSEIQKRVNRIRFLGKIHLVDKAAREAMIQRVLKAYEYTEPIRPPGPWWRIWA
jgi:hypothetical protein